MQSRFRWAAIVGVAAALSSSSATRLHAQLVNGSFEDTAGTFAPIGNNVQTLPAGSTTIPGWTVVGSELTWGRNDNPFVPNGATNGAFFLDLTGSDDAAPYGGVTQTAATTPGQPYVLEFDLITNQGDSRYAGPITLTASADAVSAPFTFDPSAATGVQSAHFSLPFVGDGSTVVTLQGTAAGTGAAFTGQFIGLDNVTIPEPAGTVLAAAMLGLSLARRRRRRRYH